MCKNCSVETQEHINQCMEYWSIEAKKQWNIFNKYSFEQLIVLKETFQFREKKIIRGTYYLIH